MTHLRVAIVGSGPAGLYAATELVRLDPGVHIDMFDRLPTPGGLVRSGVSPDHADRRLVTESLEHRAMSSHRFRYIGNVEVGRDLSVDQLRHHYDATIIAYGAAADRPLGIPGEALAGSHPVSRLVGWYNGHPDHASLQVDLDCERAVVVGNGNVALDAARILLSPIGSLAKTDIADHALTSLAKSRVREVVILGRRGAAQSSFTTPELLELAGLNIDVVVENDDLSAEVPARKDAQHFATSLKMQLFRELVQRPRSNDRKRLVFRFLSIPTEVLGAGRVEGLRVCATTLAMDHMGRSVARPTGQCDELTTGFLVRSVGYLARPIPGLPFDSERNVVPHVGGRVYGPGGEVVPGLYVAGWLKRGPQGVIGTNKACSRETVQSVLEDESSHPSVAPNDGSSIDALLDATCPSRTDYEGWRRIDVHERSAGALQHRPRVKVTEREQLIRVADSWLSK